MNVFSIDVEDWYQGIELPVEQWSGFEPRVEASMEDVLDLMARYDVTATCFVLGKVAEEHPALVRRIHEAGHEIATHGYSHEKVYNLSPERFRRELRHSIDLIQDLTGEEVRGHRAPYFTITEDSLWALDILREEGILYDSSIHPVFNYRYGIPNADRQPSLIESDEGAQMLEVPVATYPLPDPLPDTNVPCGGGAYLRIYPYRLQRWFLRKIEERGEHISVYVHPWEVDPGHPKIDLPFRVSATHYWNLDSTLSKLERLFQDFTFRSYRDVFADELEALSA
ncbi:polysaccharide deacetylase family protein (PEP-CTERM system associated) [Salinibacter ruber]|uniref:XrtA system polysaccharide deacetylase n=1 Tax=Salinibacter ruber TaxID=146919 RepID=UPI00216A1BFB|nr:XrtA system polysaccharide deacetylase [Salinibacter ruber]MCS4034084.1 polysaccharide deacetylase family protein (PEP-CTERM system associated) [Salinibacter ruber]